MAIRRKTYKGNYTDENEVFVCDTAADLSLLPVDAPQGSSAFVIDDSTTYMIDSSGVWTEVQLVNSGGSGGEDITLDNLSVTENGVYTPDSGHAYKKVTVNVGGEPADPTDGKTHVWISIDADTPDNRLVFPLCWRQSVSAGVSVDWGDGSGPETFSGTGLAAHEHTYSVPGDYEITLTANRGTLTLDGTEGTSGYAIYGSKMIARCYNRQRVRRISIGANAVVGSYMAHYCYGLSRVGLPSTATSIGAHTFEECFSLPSIAIPNGVTSIGEYAFSYCHSLETAEIPDSCTSIGAYAFRNCYGLREIDFPSGLISISEYTYQGCYGLTSVDIPDTVTSIGGGAFHSCYGLTSVRIPASVRSIGDSAFLNCYGVSEYHIEATTPPALANTNAFTGMASDCVIYIPRSTNQTVLNAYKAATNWSVYAYRMQEEAQA